MVQLFFSHVYFFATRSWNCSVPQIQQWLNLRSPDGPLFWSVPCMGLSSFTWVSVRSSLTCRREALPMWAQFISSSIMFGHAVFTCMVNLRLWAAFVFLRKLYDVALLHLGRISFWNRTHNDETALGGWDFGAKELNYTSQFSNKNLFSLLKVLSFSCQLYLRCKIPVAWVLSQAFIKSYICLFWTCE